MATTKTTLDERPPPCSNKNSGSMPYVVTLSVPVIDRNKGNRSHMKMSVGFLDDCHHERIAKDHYAAIYHLVFDWLDAEFDMRWRAYDMPVMIEDDVLGVEPAIDVRFVGSW